MDFALELLTAVLGVVIGYLLRRPQAQQLIERLKIERVEVPTIVEKIVEHVRVEYVDKPVVVEKPVLHVERVDVPTPAPVDRSLAPLAAPRSVSGPVTLVPVVFMDANEQQIQARALIDPKFRRPSMLHQGQKFVCSRQLHDGEWVYRQVTH